MSKENSTMKPQDILVLLKIIACGEEPWFQIPMARDLGLAQSEMSRSIARSKYAGLLDASGRKVRRLALMDFIEYGLTYVFPQRPGSMVRGVPTSHSASPLKEQIHSDDNFVWPYASGTVKGQAVTPLYKSVPEAIQNDPLLHELLALVDAIRLGSSREKAIAVTELKKRVLGD
ncbi:hypothetical protein [Arenicella xantha]|uniref:Uncharacterized protein n=1 Tax=Arenicella xantha TaxID=644221 RepID=A0A395JKN6_9GAMM|nr:hypothetical protein [Arenicella xantha]RBP51332.1 hypothetical protein DFR28_102752 [Arenicella xantha]